MKKIFLLIVLFLSTISAKANNSDKYESIFDSDTNLINDLRFYGAYIHQHQDFFNKAFSFQGIETGVLINHTIAVGVYSSIFASNLSTEINSKETFINIKQYGLVFGLNQSDRKFFHTGFFINLGYFTLSGDEKDFGLYDEGKPLISLEGFVMVPQIYCEFNLFNWMKLRTGISYSIYGYEDHSKVSNSDIQNFSLTFGFVFGKFN